VRFIFLLFTIQIASSVIAHPVQSQIAPDEASRPGYLGFSLGMTPEEAIGLLQRPDGSAYDRTWCRPATMPNPPTEKTCSFPLAILRRDEGPVSVTFSIRSDSSPVHVIVISRPYRDTSTVAEEVERIGRVFDATGRRVFRRYPGSYHPACNLYIWVDDRDYRASAAAECVGSRLMGEAPRVSVVLAGTTR
jgi:hypothetical protein